MIRARALVSSCCGASFLRLQPVGSGKRREAQHTSELAIGGAAKRSDRLRVVAPTDFSLPDDWAFREGVPATREECKGSARPCPYVKCRYHLWLHEADARPGRRHEQGGAPASALRPVTSRTCALDVVAEGAHTYAEIGELLGISDEGARIIAEKAIAKLNQLGYKLDDLLAAQE
jgi:hypothetical protein